MNNNKWIKVILLMTAAVFITTAAYAKNNKYERKNYYSYWRVNPFYHVHKAVKKVKALHRQISKLQRKANRLEQKKNMLEEQLSLLEGEIGSLQERKTSLNDLDSEIDGEPKVNNPKKIVCPGCYFGPVDDLDSYDMSSAYLRGAMFNGAILNNTNFSLANLKKSYFNGAQLNAVIFSGADLTCADFTGATLTDVVWGDEENGYAICPNGESPVLNVAVTTGEWEGTCEGQLTVPQECYNY